MSALLARQRLRKIIAADRERDGDPRFMQRLRLTASRIEGNIITGPTEHGIVIVTPRGTWYPVLRP